jgi:hypothetical protein
MMVMGFFPSRQGVSCFITVTGIRVECTVGHIDAIFPGKPELAGLKAVLAMQKFTGHLRVALLHDTRTHSNALLISVERTQDRPVQADRQASSIAT